MAYDDGEVRQQFSICFTTRLLGGELRTSSETKEVRFVPVAQLDELTIHPSMRLDIEHLPARADRALHRLRGQTQALLKCAPQRREYGRPLARPSGALGVLGRVPLQDLGDRSSTVTGTLT